MFGAVEKFICTWMTKRNDSSTFLLIVGKLQMWLEMGFVFGKIELEFLLRSRNVLSGHLDMNHIAVLFFL